MVELRQNVGGTYRIRILTRRDERPRVPNPGKPAVDCGDIFRSNPCQPGLIQPPLLGVDEVERAVTRDRAADAAAVLLLVHRQRRARQRVPPVQTLVAEVTVEVAVYHV